jgi:hypothetical protein
MIKSKLAVPLIIWLSIWPATTAYTAIQKQAQNIETNQATQKADIVIEDDTEPPSIHCLVSPCETATPTLAKIEVGESLAAKAEREAEELRIKEENERKERERVEDERLAAENAKREAKRIADQKASSERAKADQNRAVPKRELAEVAPPATGGSCYEIAYAMAEAKWSGQGNAMKEIVRRESGCNPKAMNKSSGACGIPQALPCSKIPGGINASVEVQIAWMITYIEGRYGTPSAAVSWHNAHNWY